MLGRLKTARDSVVSRGARRQQKHRFHDNQVGEPALSHVAPVDNTEQVGFYSYGEISPYTPGTCDLHNQTMTLTVLAER